MKNRSLLVALLLIISAGGLFASPIDEGKSIFVSRCAACHNVNRVLTGPALAGVDQRRSIDWIVKFVQSSQSLIKSGDKDAVAIYHQFNQVVMPDHPDLTPANIKSIVEYINASTQKESDAPFVKPSKLETHYLPPSLQRDYGMFLIYLMAVGLLIGLLLFIVRMNAIAEMTRKNKEAVPEVE
ncbi:cytochrome c [Nostoc ellipsosporum NOK]|jgi:mono/diheme cytochrome c family protein|nr:cytochrome c [Nostoc ellipsosporum NOK]